VRVARVVDACLMWEGAACGEVAQPGTSSRNRGARSCIPQSRTTLGSTCMPPLSGWPPERIQVFSCQCSVSNDFPSELTSEHAGAKQGLTAPPATEHRLVRGAAVLLVAQCSSRRSSDRGSRVGRTRARWCSRVFAGNSVQRVSSRQTAAAAGRRCGRPRVLTGDTGDTTGSSVATHCTPCCCGRTASLHFHGDLRCCARHGRTTTHADCTRSVLTKNKMHERR
jgi:hypothetical protein